MHTKTNQEEVVIKGFFLGRCIAFVAGDCKLFAVLSEARLGEMRLCFPFLSFPVEKLLSGAAADLALNPPSEFSSSDLSFLQ